MDAQKKAALIAGGVDVDAALERFMNNEAMLQKYLGRFPTDKSYVALVAAMDSGDQAAASMAAHTLKSVCGTLCCTNMHKLVVEQEAAMKAGDWARAERMMPDIKAEHERICAIITAN